MKQQFALCTLLLTISTGAFAMHSEEALTEYSKASLMVIIRQLREKNSELINVNEELREENSKLINVNEKLRGKVSTIRKETMDGINQCLREEAKNERIYQWRRKKR